MAAGLMSPDTTPDPTPDQQPDPSNRWRRPLVGPFSLRQLIAVVVAIAVSGVALVVLTSPLTGAPSASPSPRRPGSGPVTVGPAEEGFRIGDLAPEFSGEVNGQTVGLTDLDGNPIRLADLRGRPVWVNFWATWCPPCQEETPILRDVYAEFADRGLALVAISVQETTVDDVRAYVDRYGLGYTVGFDATSAVFHTYHAFVLPTQFFIDREGIIRKVILGGVTKAEAEQTITGLLAQ